MSEVLIQTFSLVYWASFKIDLLLRNFVENQDIWQKICELEVDVLVLHVKDSKMLGGHRNIGGGQLDSLALRVLILIGF